MKAMVFAAGMGSRLQPITRSLPKALVEVDGDPMIYWVLRRLHKAGISRVVVNVFHLADQLIVYLKHCHFEGMEVFVSDERPMLLDTGGGLEKAKSLLSGDEPVLLHNVDVLTDIPLDDFLRCHVRSGAMASLAVRNRTSARKLLFDDMGKLAGWEDQHANNQRWVNQASPKANALSFSGVHIISSDLLQQLPQPGRFSIIDLYLELASRFPIVAYHHDEGFWTDIGKPSDLQELNSYLRTPQGMLWKRNYLNPS